jgi:nucleoside-diphosphate-sugar epimerase
METGWCSGPGANDKYPDADRAINGLGWRPCYGLEETTGEALQYIREGRDV